MLLTGEVRTPEQASDRCYFIVRRLCEENGKEKPQKIKIT
jgi:hypothetical protein